MAALTKSRLTREKRVKFALMPLAAGEKAFKGGRACINTATGTVVAGQASTTLVPIGIFAQDVDNSAGGSSVNVNVDFDREQVVRYFDNDTGSAVVAADVGSLCYILDDHTVTMASSGNSVAGWVFNVDSLLGVGVVLSDAGNQIVQPEAGAIHDAVANMTALKAIAAGARQDGMVCMVLSDTAGECSMWRFKATSTAADTTENLVAVPAAGSGRWLRADRQVPLFLPATFNNADASTLFTVPVGCRLHPVDSWWDVTTSWTGGSSSAIGVSTSVSGFSTKGDILGGASGDVAATLVSSATRMTGTIGAKMATRTLGRLIMIAADVFRFDQITSTFTAGAANVRILCDVLVNPGA